MFLHYMTGICIGYILAVVLLSSKIKSEYEQVKSSPKICKNCNNFAPCVNLAGEFKGGCRKCIDGSQLFNLNMSCGHFEYTEAIQNQIDKMHLEKCFKK